MSDQQTGNGNFQVRAIIRNWGGDEYRIEVTEVPQDCSGVDVGHLITGDEAVQLLHGFRVATGLNLVLRYREEGGRVVFSLMNTLNYFNQKS